ncbi:hypothetical protein CEUSTIGMA_g6130.t1 [Chlamydomonas eustigma]|uniref:G-patch domain-containing protein n=1 Tax=Chlamydomonas eustigma TaxID=1157962 RepID=A0A250X725_9CHLO|nr:hypothetical protein CEUSTIGMA_g6130.t1 [Chlamydomonas eustigma]|eukprot:GAX78692.1 hypothetical protein CEUSTIGMA_g6130.t1 [Chlamydomonas eustigma]
MKLPVGYVSGEGVKKASGYGGYGQKLLEKFGWEKGQGLGLRKDGIKDAIEVKKKEDTLGVGVDKGPSWDWNLKYWEAAYDSAVQKVQHAQDSGSDSDSDSDSSSSDDEEVVKKVQVVQNRDGTLATASAEELKIAAQLAKDPWGRWGGRGGKMARIKEQEAAEAASMRQKLGLPATADSAVGTTSVDKAHGSCAASGEKLGNGSIPPPAKRGIIVVLSIKDDPSRKVFEFKPTPSTGWWGALYFRSVGSMGDLEKDLNKEGDELEDEVEGKGHAAPSGRSNKRQAFDEGDQEALYMRAHDLQRVGKRGLGKSDTLKIAGGKWEGTKKTFDNDTVLKEGSVKDALQALGDHQGDLTSDIAEKKKKKKKAKNTIKVVMREEEKAECGVQGTSDERVGMVESASGCRSQASKKSEVSKESRQWLKVAKRLIKNAPEGRLSARQLLKQLQKGPDAILRYLPETVGHLKKKLKSLKRLEIDGKFIKFSLSL